MICPTALHAWQHQAHGPRVQGKAISCIANKMLVYETYSDMMDNDIPTLTDILDDCHTFCTPDVSVSTLRRWWKLYEEWGELPYKVKERQKRMRIQYKYASKNEILDDDDILALKEVVDENPNLYLDELAFLFGIKTGKFIHYSSIRRCMIDKLGYSLQVLQTVAKQRCEEDENQFLHSLGLYLQSCPERLITIDESHKDRNAARRRRGWGKRGKSDGVVLNEWFESCVRYTVIAAADINGFIPAACHTVVRDEILDEGAAGTVNGEYFLYWIKNYLCPVLGNYERGEIRSVVMMDNASTHMSDEIESAILETGAVLLYGAPFSPHLNPIELYFGCYKAYLKRNNRRMMNDWFSVHREALNCVDRDMGINFFRKSKVPGSYLIATSSEISMYNIGIVN